MVMLASLVGIGWLGIQWRQSLAAPVSAESGVCLFKTVTHIPCPSCGVTRSMVSVLQGDIAASIGWNPLGILVLGMMMICPLWISWDMVRGRSSFLTVFTRIESILRRRSVAVPLIMLVASNWIWNILKDL